MVVQKFCVQVAAGGRCQTHGWQPLLIHRSASSAVDARPW